VGREIRLPGNRVVRYDELPEKDRAAFDEWLVQWRARVERNPLEGFEPFQKQREFLAAGRVKHKMAIAGNRAGKTEIGVVDDLIQAVDADCLPSWLREFKVWEPPFRCRVVVADLGNTLSGVMLEKWMRLTPREQLLGDAWDAAYDKSLRVLRFKNGSFVQFMSSDQDREKHAGAMLDRVHFDEEPPPPNGQGIYEENRRRTIDRRGQLTFTMTPLLGLSWTYDEIWTRRDEPNYTVVQWSMLDNPHLPREEVELELSSIRSEKERQAVIFGDFVHFRGRVLEQFEEDVHTVNPPSREYVQGLDVVVGFDPGLSRGGVVWCGFDRDNAMLVFDELYPSNQPLGAIVEQIKQKNERWGITPQCYVIDPASRIRDMVTARESVQTELLRLGLPTIPGQNDRQAGILEMWARLESRPPALLVSKACTKWLYEADRYLVAMDEEGLESRPKSTAKGSSFATIGPDHLIDPTRYCCLFRAWVRPAEPIPDGVQTDRANLAAFKDRGRGKPAKRQPPWMY
jgi:phage terminase large subunit-like protein